jgi:hypothetical protein
MPGPIPRPCPHPYPGPWYGGWGWGGWWPWFDYTGYFYNYSWLPYPRDFYVGYIDTAAPYITYKPTADEATIAADGTLMPADQSMGPLIPGPSTSSVRRSATNDDVFDFHGRARAVFAQGDYRQATYLAAHATVDEPRNPKTHLLYSLGMFATGEYGGAAMEAHAVIALGKTPDWPAVFQLYGNIEPYTTQLRTLETYVNSHPLSPEGRFLLGFQYMMTGHPHEAKEELLQALKLTPRDRLAAELLKAAGGTVPPEIAKQLSEMPPPGASEPALPKPPVPQLMPIK